MDAEDITLIDAATGGLVDAELRFDLSLADIAAAELAWGRTAGLPARSTRTGTGCSSTG